MSEDPSVKFEIDQMAYEYVNDKLIQTENTRITI